MASYREAASGKGALLLDDVWGEKKGSPALKLVKKPTHVIVKGTLITLIPEKERTHRKDGKPVHNYRVFKNDGITLFWREKDVAPLTPFEFQILSAIHLPGMRYEVYVSGNLKWGAALNRGDSVYATTERTGVVMFHAKVRWIGNMPDQTEAIGFGLEIMDKQHRGKGNTNGYYHGCQLFSCERDCGVIESLDKLTPFLLQKQNLQSLPSSAPSSANSTPRCGDIQEPSDLPEPRYKNRDRVVIHNEDQLAIHGTVRWIGLAKSSGETINAVGIETDVLVSNREFLLPLSGMGQHFKCEGSNTGQVFLPESLVLSEKEWLGIEARPVAHNHKQTQPQKGEVIGEIFSEVNGVDVLQQKRMLEEFKQKQTQPQKVEAIGETFSEANGIDVNQQKRMLEEYMLKQTEGHNVAQGNSNADNKSQYPNGHIKVSAQPSHDSFFSQASSTQTYRNDPTKSLDNSFTYNSSQQPSNPDKFYQRQYHANINGRSSGSKTSTEPMFHYPPKDMSTPTLTVGSFVEFSDPPRYGVIRWIGTLPGCVYYTAGVELELDMVGCDDGTWEGVSYFSCKTGRAFFCSLSSLKPDRRITTPWSPTDSFDSSRRRSSSSSQLYASSVEKDSISTSDAYDLKLAAATERLSEYQLNLTVKSDELESLKEELKSSRSKLSVKDQELAFSNSSLRECRTELVSQSNEMAALGQNLEDTTKQLWAYQTELSTKQELAESFRAQVTNKNMEIVALRNELEATKMELAAHSAEVWKLAPNRVNIGREIGNGGWGAVFEGQMQVAIKRLHLAILNPHNLTRLQRELKLLAEVCHPNLVHFIGAVFDNRSPPLIVTELLDMNLRQAYEQRQLTPQNRLSIFKDVARALDYLHQRYEPIIHRDVSAPNVLLQRLPNNQWKGKVSDLGSANFLQSAQTMGEGAIVYSPPEVIPQLDLDRDPPQQTVKIDVYSYGIVLCEVSASRFPSQENYRDMFQQVQRSQPEMYDLIIRCTKRDPNDRLTMAEVLFELENMPQFR